MQPITLPARKRNLSGQRYTRLVCLFPIEIRRNGHVVYLCKCDCGSEATATCSNLCSGHTQSCGCLCREATSKANRRHGASGTNLYRVWTQMIQRCEKYYAPNYKFYGGRGITVDTRWKVYENFVADMGQPGPGMSLDRIDSNGPYAPWNCRWADRATQAKNTRRNVFATYQGRTMCVSDWERELGLRSNQLGRRLRNGWSTERAFSTPYRKGTTMRRISTAAAAALAFIFVTADTKAADFGGAGYADLEERIAELEATTARKGNKKVSLSIFGVVNKSLFHYDVDGVDFKDTVVIENGADETRVGFAGKAQVAKDWSVGYVLEIGQGKSGVELDLTPPGSIGIGTDNDIYTRQSYAFVESPFGKVSLGLLSMQTDDFTVPSVANTTAATKRLTLAPVSGLIVTLGPLSGNLEIEPFDGNKADAVRYDTPIMSGFSAGVAWESASDSYDAAIRYAGELGGFLVMTAVGYEVDKRDNLISLFADVETKTTLANGGVKHIASGIFVQGSWAHLEIDDFDFKTDVWHVQAGFEGKWVAVGPTTIWGGMAQWDDADLTTYELGVNQNLNAAVDAYIVGKTYEIDDVDAKSLLGGVRLKF